MYPQSQEQYDAIKAGAARKKAVLAQGRPKATRAALLAGKATKLVAINEWACAQAEWEMGGCK